MKVIIKNIKSEDKKLICQFCHGEEFYKDIIENKVVKKGMCYDDYAVDEIVRFTCKECGWIAYFDMRK